MTKLNGNVGPLISVLFIFTGVIFAVIGGWLWSGRVPPNSTTGFRTAKTLADPELWYRVNTATGKYFFVLGLVVIFAAAALHFFGAAESPTLSAIILTGLIVAGSIIIAVVGYRMT